MRVLIAELKVETRRQVAELETKTEARFGALETKLAEMETKIIRWVFLVMLGNAAISLAANALVNAFKSL